MMRRGLVWREAGLGRVRDVMAVAMAVAVAVAVLLSVLSLSLAAPVLLSMPGSASRSSSMWSKSKGATRGRKLPGAG